MASLLLVSYLALSFSGLSIVSRCYGLEVLYSIVTVYCDAVYTLKINSIALKGIHRHTLSQLYFGSFGWDTIIVDLLPKLALQFLCVATNSYAFRLRVNCRR